MKIVRGSWAWALPCGAAFLYFFGLVLSANAANHQQLKAHVPAAVKQLTPIQRLHDQHTLHLAIDLPLRDQKGLDALLQQIYDPANPLYHHYLTPQQFTERFGPTQQDYETVKAWAKSNGLQVTRSHLNRVVLNVSGTAAAVERALHLNLNVYKHPTENRTFFAPDAEPSFDLDVQIQNISGLEDYYRRKPSLRLKSAANGSPPLAANQLSAIPANGRSSTHSTATMTPAGTGSGTSGSYLGLDFRAAYVPGTTLAGAGQNVALVQFDGFWINDITAYAVQAGISMPNITVIPIDGGVSSPTSDNSEVCLDIEMVMSMATNVSRIYVYEEPNDGSPWEDILSQIVNDNLCKQISCSWFGGSANPAAENIFMQMAAQGQTFFCASGDSDAFTGAIPFPDESPDITLVGGTTLTTTGPRGAYVSETVWNWGGGTGSSGGIAPD